MSILFIDGEIRPTTDFISINHLGVGVFETFLVKKYSESSGRCVGVLGFEKHLERLKSGSLALQLKLPDLNEVKVLLTEAIRRYPWENNDTARTRIIVLDGHWAIQIEPFSTQVENSSGINLKSVTAERFMPEVKSCSALVSAKATKLAKSHGADEALLIDRSEIVREAAWANFFWFDCNQVLHTAKDKMLNGVTRQIVLELAKDICKIEMSDIKIGDLLKDAEHAFLTQSTRGIVEVTSIDDKNLKSSLPAFGALNAQFKALSLDPKNLTLFNF